LSVTVRQFANPEDLARAAATDWLQLLKKNDSQMEAVLSGGRITKSFFNELVKLSQGLLTESKVDFFWADERCVPPDDPESNYNIARQLLFEPLKIPAERIHRIRGEADPEIAAKEAADNVRKINPTFDIVFLGMGEDGHIASLFPGEPEEIMNDPAVYRAVTAVKPPPKRITLGYGAIVNAMEVWVLASGAGKETALAASLAGNTTPLWRLLRLRSKPSTIIYTDIPVPQGLVG